MKLINEEDLKAITESLSKELKYKCFRHQFQNAIRRCRLCDAKQEAKGKFEYARIIFIKVWHI